MTLLILGYFISCMGRLRCKSLFSINCWGAHLMCLIIKKNWYFRIIEFNFRVQRDLVSFLSTWYVTFRFSQSLPSTVQFFTDPLTKLMTMHPYLKLGCKPGKRRQKEDPRPRSFDIYNHLLKLRTCYNSFPSSCHYLVIWNRFSCL